jgi:hypothetical protein
MGIQSTMPTLTCKVTGYSATSTDMPVEGAGFSEADPAQELFLVIPEK